MGTQRDTSGRLRQSEGTTDGGTFAVELKSEPVLRAPSRAVHFLPDPIAKACLDNIEQLQYSSRRTEAKVNDLAYVGITSALAGIDGAARLRLDDGNGWGEDRPAPLEPVEVLGANGAILWSAEDDEEIPHLRDLALHLGTGPSKLGALTREESLSAWSLTL
jgi:hypothetical protein